MAKITATTKELEHLVNAFAQQDISDLSYAFKEGRIAVQNLNVEGEAEVRGLSFSYAVKLSKDDGVSATVLMK